MRCSGALLIWFLTAIVLAVGTSGMPQERQKSVLEGVYSKAQATRGEQAYKKACGYCHRDNLQGDEGPALVGSKFTSQWRGQTLADLFDRMQTTMPADAPGTLTTQAYIDIVGFILDANEWPPGDEDLPADMEQLKRIVIAEKPGR